MRRESLTPDQSGFRGLNTETQDTEKTKRGTRQWERIEEEEDPKTPFQASGRQEPHKH